MLFMFVTLLTSHSEMSPLKEEAPMNMLPHVGDLAHVPLGDVAVESLGV